MPNPQYTFRITNIQSADGVTCAVRRRRPGRRRKKIAHIHPDYSYGRNAFDHFMIAYKKLVPGAEVVSEGWPKLGTTDFTAHITKTMSSNPDLIVSSVWGGDYVAMYKQALRYGMFNRRQVREHDRVRRRAACHRQGSSGRRHRRRPLQLLLHLSAGQSLAGQQDLCGEVLQALERVSELPVGRRLPHAHMYRTAVEKANRLVGGWPDEEAIISQLEGMYFETAPATSTSGPTIIRATRTL